MSFQISRTRYANMYGPTTGDKVRLADTDLIIEIEKDHTVYGDEAKFGAGKTIRDGMAQSATAMRKDGVLDFVITSVMIMLTHSSPRKTTLGGCNNHFVLHFSPSKGEITPTHTVKKIFAPFNIS